MEYFTIVVLVSVGSIMFMITVMVIIQAITMRGNDYTTRSLLPISTNNFGPEIIITPSPFDKESNSDYEYNSDISTIELAVYNYTSITSDFIILNEIAFNEKYTLKPFTSDHLCN